MVLPQKGNNLPGAPARKAADLAGALALALRAEFGDRRHAVKRIMRWTGASGRTVRYWLAGEAVPNGRCLIELIARCDAVLETVLAVGRRVDLLQAFVDLRRKETAVPGGAPSPRPEAVRDPDRDPGGPGRDPDRAPAGSRRDLTGFNERQRWFLARLKQDPLLGATDIARRFGVSPRTAKRDVAGLKTAAEVRFVGTRRRGRYVPPSG